MGSCRGSVSARWVAVAAALMLMIIATSCTTGNDQPAGGPDDPSPTTSSRLDEAATTTSTFLGPRRDADIVGASLTGGSLIELQVSHGTCDVLEGWSEQGADSVVIGVWRQDVTTVGEDQDVAFDCGDEERVDAVRIELDAPLDDRALVIVQGLALGEPVCFTIDDDPTCRSFLLRTASGDQEIAGSPDVLPLGFAMGSGATTPLSLGGTKIDLTTDVDLSGALVLATYSLFQPDAGVWGSVTVHNLDRDVSDAERYEGDVAGRPAYVVRYHDEPDNEGGSVVTLAGPWWVDVRLWSSAPDVDSVLSRFINGLEIDEVDRDLPRLRDATGWLSDPQEVVITAPPNGFYLAIAPNCDFLSELHCRRDVGYVGPGWADLSAIVGQMPNPSEPFQELIVPDDLVVSVTEFGPFADLVTCTGVPAFDPLILPERQPLAVAIEAVGIYTGVTDWQQRRQPGVETWFVGDPDRPGAVATYVRDDVGTWAAESVLTCQ